MAKDFIKQWDGRRLEDWGSVVSKEFNQFQNAFKREVERLAQEGGARLVSYGKGHYDMYGFLEKDGTYVYFSYGALDRTKVQLTSASDFISPLLMRTAKHEKDYRGGSNNNVLFTQFLPTMQRLFKQQQPSVVTTQPEPVKEVKPSVVTTQPESVKEVKPSVVTTKKPNLTTELTWLHYANLFFLFFNFNQAEAQQAA